VCTVTIVPLEDGFRLRCNRDERRDRPEALAPLCREFEDRSIIYPEDPVGGGTWIGVNDAGLAAALLNRTLLDQRPARATTVHGAHTLRSRGVIIPQLLLSATLADAVDRMGALKASDFARFRLVLVQDTATAIVSSDGSTLTISCADLDEPNMFTSSSLGDAVVEGPRRQLFVELFAGDESSWLRAQRRFHHHRWPSRPDVSVRMERYDARTVSQTVVDVRSTAVQLRYIPLRCHHRLVRGAA
jgi:hypothetical protein